MSRFSMTLVDLFAEINDVAQDLNPKSRYHVDDMRIVRPGRRFDAVFIHDAIDYMLTEGDLEPANGTAFAHCPGWSRSQIPLVELGSEPAATVTEYLFLLSDRDGVERPVHETHRTGLFSELTWLRGLTEAGFRARAVRGKTDEAGSGRITFIGDRSL